MSYEHNAHIRDSSKYKWFTRDQDALGPGIHKIWGISTGDHQDLQAIRFDAKQFTVKRAQVWLADNGYVPLRFEAGKVGQL